MKCEEICLHVRNSYYSPPSGFGIRIFGSTSVSRFQVPTAVLTYQRRPVAIRNGSGLFEYRSKQMHARAMQSSSLSTTRFFIKSI